MPKSLLNLGDQGIQIEVRQIKLVNNDRTRQIERPRDLHQPTSDHLNPALRIDHHRNRFDGRQSMAVMAMTDQIWTARRVDQVDPLCPCDRMCRTEE